MTDTITPTLLAHVAIGYSMIYFYDHSPYTENGGMFNCLTQIQLQGCEGSYNFPTIITGNTTSPEALGGMQQLGNALAAHGHSHGAAFRQRQHDLGQGQPYL